MSCQEVLIVWVLNVTYDNAASSDEAVFAHTRMHVHDVYGRS